MFTGDRSGDVLFAALHRAGSPPSRRRSHADDGLALTGLRITAPVHCAPPANKPTPDELRHLPAYLGRELELLAPTVRVAVALGAFGWQALLPRWPTPAGRPPAPAGIRARRRDLLRHPDGRLLTAWAAITSASRTPSPDG